MEIDNYVMKYLFALKLVATFQEIKSQETNLSFSPSGLFSFVEARRNGTHICCLATNMSNILGTFNKTHSTDNIDLHTNLKLRSIQRNR